MKLNKIAAAVVLASAAASANAAWTSGGEGGELIFNVWNDATKTSFSMDLGVLASEAPLGSESLTFQINSNALAHVGGSAADLTWNLGGISSIPPADPALLSGFGVYATGVSLPSGTGANFGNIGGQQASFDQLANVMTTSGTEIVSGENPVFTMTGEATYAGNDNVFGDTGYQLAGTTFFDTTLSAAEGTSLYAYRVGQSFEGGVPSTVVTESLGTWSFDASAGTLSYSAGSTNPVPVPAAVWMLASGLLGLAGVARRKKA